MKTAKFEVELAHAVARYPAAEYIPVKKFPPEMVREDKTNIYAHHMEEILKNSYEQACLPEEAGYTFAKIT